MDCERIYRDFIRDRRVREARLTGYTERHHILPRALGGTNEPANLIRLNAGDHFFAHLLLAKMHGGKMWAPVAFMVGGNRISWGPRRSRREYGWARAELARSMIGSLHPGFDHDKYDLRNKDGRVWSGLQSEMSDIGLLKPLANMLLKGRVKSANGWFLASRAEPRRDREFHPAYRAETFAWCHLDGRQFCGTAYDMALEFGLSRRKTANVRAGRQRVHKGWYIDGLPPFLVGRGAKGPVPIGEGGVKSITLRHEDGRTFEGSRRQAVEGLGVSSGNLSMVMNGKRAKTKGWRPVI